MSAPTAVGGWDLVIAAQRGDREAFGQLYGRYADEVARYVGRRVPDRHLAQDLTAETFTRALRRLDSVSNQGKDVGAWFIRIAHNLLTDHWRSQHTQRVTAVAQLPDSVVAQAGPEEVVCARESARELHQAVGRLTPAQQEVIRGRYLEELPVARVAAATGRTEGATKALAHRGLEALRAELSSARLRGGGADPLARARRQLSEAARRVAQQHQAEESRATQLGGWRSDDHTTNRRQADDASAEVAC